MFVKFNSIFSSIILSEHKIISNSIIEFQLGIFEECRIFISSLSNVGEFYIRNIREKKLKQKLLGKDYCMKMCKKLWILKQYLILRI